MTSHCKQNQSLSPGGISFDFIFLSSEPFRFKDKHRQILQDKIPTATIIDVDGEMFSWYGSRVCQSFDYFQDELMPKMTLL